MAVADVIKANVFSERMPDMPPVLREMWQVAFMYRRKYSNPVDKDPFEFFKAAWNDALFITHAYNDNETIQDLILEAYSDIERQWKVYEARREAAEAG